MKIRVTLKAPDYMADDVDRFFTSLWRPEGIEQDEWSDVCEERAAQAKAEITRRWMPYGEYLSVEFDMDAGTATVLQAKESK